MRRASKFPGGRGPSAALGAARRRLRGGSFGTTAATLRPGEWWRARVPRGTPRCRSPSSSRTRRRASRATWRPTASARSRCGWRGSAEAPPTATAFDQLDEDQRRSGDDYSLSVGVHAARRAAERERPGYHVAVVGWDGTNSFIVRAEQMRVPLATSVCPALSGSGRSRASPSRATRTPPSGCPPTSGWSSSAARRCRRAVASGRGGKPPPTTTPTSYATRASCPASSGRSSCASARGGGCGRRKRAGDAPCV